MELFAAEATVADVNLRLRLYMIRLNVFLEAKKYQRRTPVTSICPY